MHSHRKITSHLYDLRGWGNWHKKACVQHAVFVMPAITHCGYFFKKSTIWLLYFFLRGKQIRQKKKDER